MGASMKAKASELHQQCAIKGFARGDGRQMQQPVFDRCITAMRFKASLMRRAGDAAIKPTNSSHSASVSACVIIHA